MSQDKLDLKNLVQNMFSLQAERWVIPMNPTAVQTENAPQLALTATRPTLTGAHRCDACGARAYVQVEFAWWADETQIVANTGDLLFCGHHGTKYEAKLREVGFNFVDERWNIQG